MYWCDPLLTEQEFLGQLFQAIKYWTQKWAGTQGFGWKLFSFLDVHVVSTPLSSGFPQPLAWFHHVSTVAWFLERDTVTLVWVAALVAHSFFVATDAMSSLSVVSLLYVSPFAGLLDQKSLRHNVSVHGRGVWPKFFRQFFWFTWGDFP